MQSRNNNNNNNSGRSIMTPVHRVEDTPDLQNLREEVCNLFNASTTGSTLMTPAHQVGDTQEVRNLRQQVCNLFSGPDNGHDSDLQQDLDELFRQPEAENMGITDETQFQPKS